MVRFEENELVIEIEIISINDSLEKRMLIHGAPAR